MHELSLAMSVVETAEEAAQMAGASCVVAVHLRLGALAGVVCEPLLFSFEIAARDTLLQGARLVIEELPAVVFCPHCRENVTLPSVQRFRCPTCGGPTPKVVQGHEIEVVSIEIEEEGNE